ncbi:acyl-CoA thioesterase [Eionea flava]
MSILLHELSDLLTLERIEENTFRGRSQNIGTGMVFGGQVLGQAISAAQETVAIDRKIHSAHAYFLRAGDYHLPIMYSVDRTRDGRSYSSRTITAIQNGQPIFTMMCSFQTKEESDLHYSSNTVIPNFNEGSFEEINLESESLAERSVRSKILSNQPFLLRIPKEETNGQVHHEIQENYWIKANHSLQENTLLQYSLLAYTSDFRLLTSTLRPVNYRYRLNEVSLATVCHTIWFHREFSLNNWLFVQCDPLSVCNGRGLSKGSIYREDGKLVATTMQEGVVRKSLR